MRQALNLKIVSVLATSVLLAASELAGAETNSSIWTRPELCETPAVFPAEGISEPGVRALFFENVPYHGKPTRVFAWYGTPKTGGPKFPAMILVHGGGGTAYARWVRLWNDRGYAAIAMDTYGAVPDKKGSKFHEWPGPSGALDTFEQVDQPAEDQWPYHAVAAVMRANSLIRSFPEVDPARIGITGISWGGYLTCMAAGIDGRFACAVPVYGCGFFDYNSGGFFDKLRSMGERGRKWAALWDASTVLANARIPMLWLNDDTDFWFPIPPWQKSYRLAPGTKGIVLRTDWPHGQSFGESAPETGRFADSILSGGKPMPRIIEQKVENGHLLIRWESPLPVAEVAFNYTADSGSFSTRKWNTAYLPFNAEEKNVSAEIPPEATAFYCNIVDRDGVIASSECVEHTPTARPAASGGFTLLNEDFEGRGVGISPKGVTQDRARGASIEITDEAAASGSRSLRFTDAPGLEYRHFPVREFYIPRHQMDKGGITLSFNFRNSKAKPGDFVVEMRDMRKPPHQRGPRLEFMPNGKLMAGDKEVAELPFDTWTKIDVTMTLDGSGGKTYKLTVTGKDGKSQTFDMPCSPGFGAVSWIAFMMTGDAAGVVYLDDILFSCK